MLLRVLASLSSPLLFYKTWGPQSLELMEQTQNECAHLARSFRNLLDIPYPSARSSGILFITFS